MPCRTATGLSLSVLGSDSHGLLLWLVSQGCSWLTPVEVFQPWYARALAEYILQRHLQGAEAQSEGGPVAWERGTGGEKPLHIYEIGGGGGTCAANVLDFLKQTVPEVYARTQYVSVEISWHLARRQLKYVAAADEGHVDDGHFSVQNRNAIDRSGTPLLICL